MKPSSRGTKKGPFDPPAARHPRGRWRTSHPRGRRRAPSSRAWGASDGRGRVPWGQTHGKVEINGGFPWENPISMKGL